MKPENLENPKDPNLSARKPLVKETTSPATGGALGPALQGSVLAQTHGPVPKPKSGQSVKYCSPLGRRMVECPSVWWVTPFLEVVLKGDLKGHQSHLAVGQNQWYHFGVGAPPSLVYFSGDFSGDWDVHWGSDLDFDPWPTNNGLPLTHFENLLPNPVATNHGLASFDCVEFHGVHCDTLITSCASNSTHCFNGTSTTFESGTHCVRFDRHRGAAEASPPSLGQALARRVA